MTPVCRLRLSPRHEWGTLHKQLQRRDRAGRDTDRISGSSTCSWRRSWRSSPIWPWFRSGISSGRTFVADGALTLDSFRRAYAAIGLGEMALNSLWFMVGTTALSIGLGTVARLSRGPDGSSVQAADRRAHGDPARDPGRSVHDRVDLPGKPPTGALNTLLEPLLGPGAVDIFGLRRDGSRRGPALSAVRLPADGGGVEIDRRPLEESARVSGAGDAPRPPEDHASARPACALRHACCSSPSARSKASRCLLCSAFRGASGSYVRHLAQPDALSGRLRRGGRLRRLAAGGGSAWASFCSPGSQATAGASRR